MDRWTHGAISQAVYQAVAIASTTTLTSSIWAAQPASGGATSAFNSIRCQGTTVSACTCGTGDGSACTTVSGTFVGANECAALLTTLKPTPTRFWASATCAAAITAPITIFGPGNYTSTFGSGDFWGAQVETGLYPTPFTGTRNAGVYTVPLPALHTSNTWCIGITATPGGGRAWNQPGTQRLLAAGGVGAANSFGFYQTVGNNVLSVYDSAGVLRFANTANIGWANGSAHRIVGCNRAGAITLYVDGVLGITVTTGGTGLWSSTPATVDVGSLGGGNAWDGSIRDLRVYNGQTYKSGM
jgi:hypothetical protein